MSFSGFCCAALIWKCETFLVVLNHHELQCEIDTLTVFENPPKCRIRISQLWHFPLIFVLLKLTCLVTLTGQASGFQKLAKIGHFYELWSTQNVNVARFANNVECDVLLIFKHCESKKWREGGAIRLKWHRNKNWVLQSYSTLRAST